MENMQLFKTIKGLAVRAGIEIDLLSLDMDLTLAMNDEQRADLAAMIEYLGKHNFTPGQILANVLHDCHGLRAIYQNPGKANLRYFSPRSTGYAAKVA